MERVGVRELRQNASVWLRRVQAGESFEITDDGQLVALLAPPPRGSVIERLIAEGRIIPGGGNLADIGPPLEPTPGVPLPSEILERMREHEP